MKKIRKWLKKNKGLSVVLLLTIVLLVFIMIIFIKLIVGNSSNSYGNRLDGIDNVKIDEDTYAGAKAEIIDSGLAEDADIRLQGKIVYTTITLKSDTSVAKAKSLASSTLDNYKEEELNYYDFSFFLKWQEEESIKVIVGNKHHNLDSITWTN